MSDKHAYGDISELKHQARVEAIRAEMEKNHYSYDDGQFVYRWQDGLYGQERWYSIFVDWEGNAKGPGVLQDSLDEASEYFLSVKNKWHTNIDNALAIWESIPDESLFETSIDTLRRGVQTVATGRGNAGSKLGNPDLEDIEYIRDFLPSKGAGQTVSEFYRKYGPARLETVLDAYCDTIAVLGMAATAQQKIWETTRVDVPTVLAGAVKGFKDAQDGGGSWETVLSVVGASAGLVGAFATGPAGVAAAALGSGASFVSSVMSALNTEKSEDTNKYSGDTADEVFKELEKSLEALNKGITDQETGISTMLQEMLALLQDAGNRRNFHINPDRGLDPDFTDGGVIKQNFDTMERVGHSAMPQIAKAFFQASDLAQESRDPGQWARPGGVGTGTYGPYYDWEALLYALFPLMDDTGAEVIQAGKHLAEAAGIMRSTDEDAKEIYKMYQKEIRDGDGGWQSPYTPPPVPPRKPDLI